MNLEALAADILARAAGRRRYLFAIAGPPGAGKSTLAEALLARLEAAAPGQAALLAMDGYHLDNDVLSERGLLARKGAPQTFDVDGLLRDLARIRAGGEEVIVPVFDRDLDLARAGARVIAPEPAVVLVEGNYLLLAQSPWSRAAPLLDRTLFIDVAPAELHRRLVRRWLGYGLDPAAATERAESNDLANAALVADGADRADLIWQDGIARQGGR